MLTKIDGHRNNGKKQRCKKKRAQVFENNVPVNSGQQVGELIYDKHNLLISDDINMQFQRFINVLPGTRRINTLLSQRHWWQKGHEKI